MQKLSFILLLLLTSTIFSQELYKEKYRPQFHFTPQKNWCNDPNGLVYFNGEYHLFYQSNPFGNQWGHMSWSHAVSKDLLHWQQLPVAIKEENGVMIFSGSGVIDEKNTSGFGKNAMVAIYTGHSDTLQTQNIAFSNDAGRTFTKFNNNPVLNLHQKDFRDPNVFWFEKNSCWIMSVSHPVEHQIEFYQSKNLKDWKPLSKFGPAGDTRGVWECPDLMRVSIEGSNEKKWVLFISQNSTMQYFVGEFDGAKFINENPLKIFKQDYGTDYYAAIAYHNTPDKNPVSIGWLNNWNYANSIPTSPWKSTMSLPRKLSLKKINGEWILIQQPVRVIEKLRNKAFVFVNRIVAKEETVNFSGQVFELELLFQPSSAGESGIKLAVGNNHFLKISYDATNQQMIVDRSQTNSSFNKTFASINTASAKIKLHNGKLKWHIYFDKSIVEIFVNDGETVFTTQIFPEEDENNIQLFSTAGNTKFDYLTFWKMKSIW
ncbi:levanase precursor [mine drainage metagenome]|uniref:Levanase n=1 Tax=mine drainage metagenome TaxID=410659 RepID=A0A1J5SMZ6_9ZZZZ